MDPTKELRPRELEAALLLAQGRRKAEVARHLGVTRKTIYNWLERPEFRAAVGQLAQELAEEAKARLGRKSLAVLEEALDADDVRPTRYSEKLSAARTALQVAGLAGPQAAAVQIARSTVLFYGARPERRRPEIDYLEITDEEIDAADRELRVVEEALLGKRVAERAGSEPALPEKGAVSADGAQDDDAPLDPDLS